MDRSISGRAAIGRAARPFGSGAPRSRDRRRRGGSTGRARTAFAAPRALGRIGKLTAPARGAVAFVWARRRARIALIATLIALPLLAGGWMWLRHSSLVAVEHVKVTGVHGPEAHAIEAALIGAAKQ